MPRTSTEAYSNIERRDYVGPEACGDCHDEKYEAWGASLHASMNRLAGEDGAIVGDFGGARVEYQGGTARFERVGGEAVMGLGKRRFRVTRTIGTEKLQQYVGVEIGGDGVERRLPFGWWVRQARWMPEPYFDSWYDDEAAFDAFAPAEEPWATRCAWCHNTYPFELRARRGEVGYGLEQFVALDGAAPIEGNLLPIDQLVTVGVSCESCHGGGREHAEEDAAIRFWPSSPRLHARAGAPDLRGGRKSAVVVDAICGSCHSTPAPRYPDGAAVRNSSEALDLLAGACASAIKCTDCHDPHTKGAVEVTCGGCHEDIGADHARHQGVDCVDCHMPRIVEGISSFVRSHRISSPGDPAMLAVGAPNACNLCHLDRSIEWTLAALEDGWGRRVRPAPGWLAAYGNDFDTPMGEVWLDGNVETLRITAAAAYARSPLGAAALPRLLASLDDPIPFYRMWMLFAVEDVLGRRLSRREYDPMATPARRMEQIERLERDMAAPDGDDQVHPAGGAVPRVRRH